MNCVQIEESNQMGTEVDNKGKQPLHPMPDEVVLPPTVEEDPKMPEGGDDEGMEEPPATSAATTATTIRRMAQLTSASADGVQAQEQHRLLLEGDGQADERQGDPGSGLGHLRSVHQIKIGYMVTFKLLTPDTLKVIIFDDDGIEVVNKCGKHDEAFAAKE
ncbi:hypothetical protein VPH35_078754 [Triticum aestivum]